MKQNEYAVSPVIGVMLMIVVTIIIAAVVSAFAANSDMTKRTGPSTTLSSQIMYSPQDKAQLVTVSYNVGGTVGYHDAVDCTQDSSDFCQKLVSYSTDLQTVLGATTQDDFEMNEGACSGASDSAVISACQWPGGAYVSGGTGGNLVYLANPDGLLFTNEGGDPIDLKDLELTVRYYDLTGSQKYSDTKPISLPSGAQIIQVSPAGVDTTLPTRYFVKVNSSSSDDTIIRSGDQFMFLVDHYGSYHYTDYWAVDTVGIDVRSGVTEWWLTHVPSGNVLAHGVLKVPNT
ncbi:MAG: type IV pilin N-terminal domain-containing protein [Methanoregula sp.]|jgi:FlaG/FlaF family flagellin (archaellin)